MNNGAANSIASHTDKNKVSHNGRKDRKKHAARVNAKLADADMSEVVQSDSTNNATGFADKKNIMWVILSGAMALTFVVMLFLPDSGMGSGLISTYSAMLWCGFFGATLWRYRDSSGWAGFAYGSVLGLIVQFCAQLV